MIPFYSFIPLEPRENGINELNENHFFSLFHLFAYLVNIYSVFAIRPNLPVCPSFLPRPVVIVSCVTVCAAKATVAGSGPEGGCFGANMRMRA